MCQHGSLKKLPLYVTSSESKRKRKGKACIGLPAKNILDLPHINVADNLKLAREVKVNTRDCPFTCEM